MINEQSFNNILKNIKEANIRTLYVLSLAIKPGVEVRPIHLRYFRTVLCRVGYVLVILDTYRFKYYYNRITVRQLLYFRESYGKDVIWALVCKIKFQVLINTYQNVIFPLLKYYTKYNRWVGIAGFTILMTIRHKWWNLSYKSKVIFSHQVLILYLIMLCKPTISRYLPSRSFLITKIAADALVGNVIYCLIHISLNRKKGKISSLPLLSPNAQSHIVKG